MATNQNSATLRSEENTKASLIEALASGAVQIGRGSALHPATRKRFTRPDGSRSVFIEIHCSCGCKGRQSRQLFRAGATATCDGQGVS
jgi:hypothetical protein